MTMILDTNVLTEMVGDDPAIHQALLAQFVPQTKEIIDEIDAALAQQDLQAVGDLGHKMKSSARYMGAMELGDVSEALQDAGKSGDAAAVATIVARLHDVFAATTKQIDETFS